MGNIFILFIFIVWVFVAEQAFSACGKQATHCSGFPWWSVSPGVLGLQVVVAVGSRVQAQLLEAAQAYLPQE